MYALNELAWSNMKLMSVTWEVSQAPISSLKPVASMKSWFMSVTKETSQASMPPYVALAAVSSDSHSSTAERNAARFENVVCAIANRGNSSSKRSCRTRFNRPMVGGKDQATTRRLGSEIFPAFLLAGWTPAQQFSERDRRGAARFWCCETTKLVLSCANNKKLLVMRTHLGVAIAPTRRPLQGACVRIPSRQLRLE